LNGIGIKDKTATIAIQTKAYEKACPVSIANDAGATVVKLTEDGRRLTKTDPYSGIYIEEEWEEGRLYILEYEIKCTEGTLKNIGGHCGNFIDGTIVGFGSDSYAFRTFSI
jgi:hypothetical protein